MDELSIMGIIPVLKNLKSLIGRINQTVDDIIAKKPDVVLSIDSPDFCLRVQKKLHAKRQGTVPQLMHLVAPTVWVWRPGRAKKISKFLDHLLTIYPFEGPFFEKHGLRTTFVGHPLANTPSGDGAVFRKVYGLKENESVVCFLPGSRRSEIEMAMPLFKEVASHLSQANPDLRIVIPVIAKRKQQITKLVKEWPITPILVEGDEARRDAFAASRAALAVSGTVALQMAVARLPMVIVYKMMYWHHWVVPQSWIQKLAGIKGRWVCMVNILQNKDVVPELLQENCTSQRMIEALLPLLAGDSSQITELEDVIHKLHSPQGHTPEDAIAYAIKNQTKR